MEIYISVARKVVSPGDFADLGGWPNTPLAFGEHYERVGEPCLRILPATISTDSSRPTIHQPSLFSSALHDPALSVNEISSGAI